MSLDFGEYLYNNLPDVEFVDFSRSFNEIKAVKSEEELELARKCVRAHEHLIDTVPSLLRPGRFEYEILADLEHRSRYIGCDNIGNIAVGSASLGKGPAFYKNFRANRCLEAGDAVAVMIEVSGPGGIYGEVSRTFCLGEPKQSLLDLFEIAKNAQYAVANAMKPGVKGKDLDRVYNDYVTQFGIEKNARFVGHGQGYDMMEAPTIGPREEMEIKENMFFAIHPRIVKNGEVAMCCDNFVVTKEGALRMTRTKQKIIQVEY